MDRRTLLAIVLSIGIFTAWQKLYIEPRLPHQRLIAQPAPVDQSSPPAQATQPLPGTGAAQTTATSVGLSAPSQAAPAAASAAQTQTLATRTGDAVIGNGATILAGWNLKEYRQKLEHEASLVDLQSVTHSLGTLQLAFNDPKFAYLENVRGTLTPTPTGAHWAYEDANIALERDVTGAPDQPWLDIRLAGKFKGTAPTQAYLSLSQHSAKSDPEVADRQLFFFSGETFKRTVVKDRIDLTPSPGPVRYVGTSTRYFELAVLPQGLPEAKGVLQAIDEYAGQASLAWPVTAANFVFPVKVYFGPKDLDLLRSVDPTLDHTVDFGWFTILAYPILKLLRALYHVFGNYGVAIILLTILVKLLTAPLTYKSMKSMREMAKLQPQLARVREKYKDDKEALNREMLVMMRSHGYNPMAGCLPMLIPMPIFFALYRVLYGSIELYQAPFAFWIHDLSSRDPYYVTPVLLSLTMFIQQRITPNTATDPAQQRMMQFMPLMFGAFMLALPSGLTLYMLVNAITSIIQQMIMNKKLGPMPQMPRPVPTPARAR